MVVAAGRAHEHGLAAELVGDDLEAEDAAVELGGDRRVADEQDGVVEARDGDAHDGILRRGRGRVDRRSRRHRLGHRGTDELPAGLPAAAVGDVEGDVEEGEPSSWRARASGPTSTGRRPIDSTSSRTVARAAASSAAT